MDDDAPTAPPPASAPPAAPPPTPPRLAGRYRLDALLGSGAQGRTWRGVRLEDELPVAIKALHLANVDNWKAIELFEREAKALQAVGGVDGVPRLIEYLADTPGDDGAAAATQLDPVFYLVQELVPGESLAQLLAGGARFTTEEVVELARGVLRILHDLHHRNPPVIHRDLKPGNIMRRPDGGVSLVDFGAVSDAVSSAAEGSTIAGTIGYMAPEQFQGRALPASDLYGLGATLVHLLSGVAPSAMESRVFRLEFEPHLGPGVPPALVALLRSMLEPDADERIGSAEAVLDALEHLDARDLLPAVAGEAEGALAPASKLGELRAVGQAGHLTIFHALPETTPRPFPWPYRRTILGRYVLYIGGGFAAAALGLVGALAILGLGATEAAMFLLVPFFFGYWLYRGSRRFTKLVREGRKTLGQVTGVRGQSDGHDILYEYRIGEHVYQGRTRVSHADILVEPGSQVGVLYQADAPAVSVLHPLPSRAIVAALMQDDEG